MKLGISEILEQASKKKTKADKVAFLRAHYSPQLGDILQFALHPNVKVLLPEGPAPYDKTKGELSDENHGMLYSKARELYLFVEGGNSKLSQNRREALFIQLLESIHPKDAELMVAAKDKKIPYKGLTKEVINEAFQELYQMSKSRNRKWYDRFENEDYDYDKKSKSDHRRKQKKMKNALRNKNLEYFEQEEDNA